MPKKTSTGASHIRIDRTLQIAHLVIGFVVFAGLILGPTIFSVGDSPRTPAVVETGEEEQPDGFDNSRKLADQISALIAQLDAQDFEQRESAQKQLAKIGEVAIEPLAFQSFDCSPESCWRIKKALETICTDGDEAVFYKATCILQLRYDGGNLAMARRLAELEKQWRGKRKTEAIATLRQKGATIEDPLEGADDVFHNMPGVLGNNLVFVGGHQLIDSGKIESDLPVKKSIAADREQLSEKELKKKIRSILESNIDDNRRLVFGNASSPEKLMIEDPRIAFQNRIRMNQLMINGRFVNQARGNLGVTVRFGDKWQGEQKDFELLKDISNIQHVKLENQSIKNHTITAFATIPTLKKLTFDGCQLKASELKKADWSPVLGEIEFANQAVTADLIESCAAIPSLQSLSFNACEIKGAAIEGLKDLDSLRVLQFKETEIDKSVFETLAELKQLTYLNLSVCKFETRDYRALKEERPKLQIAYTAQAFLGVRGPVDLGAFDSPERGQAEGCPITEVIHGSGAQKAGMKVGDVIEEVNGQSIERFEDLRLHIAQHKVGDTLDVVVRRSGKPVKLAVKLGVQNSALR